MNKLYKLTTIAFCMMLLSCGNNKTNTDTEALKVETETVGEGQHDLNKSFVGEVEPQSSTAVSFTGMGTVTKVFVEEGQHVSAGQTIAQMDPTQSRNAVDAAQATLFQAEDAFNRLKILHDANSLSEMDWVEIQTKVQQARSSLEMAKKQLADCTLKAPCSGVIGTKNIQSGQTALPSQAVCTILNINSVKVRVSIPEKEIGNISSSTPTHITIDAISQSFDGGRIEKSVQADALTHTYNIRINVPNPGMQLLPGMVANVSINNDMGSDSALTTLPVRCIQQSADGHHFVWTVRNNEAHRQDVTIGATYGNRIEITSGIKCGEKVIVNGYQKVSENSKVK